MKSALYLILSVLPLSCFADECTKQLTSYEEGLAVMSVAASDAATRDKAATEIRRIEKARRSISDCEVVQTIPALVKSNKAIRTGDSARHK